MKKVKPVDVSKFLGKVRNRVHKVGVELEGGWSEGRLPTSVKLEHDGSVFRHGRPMGIAKHGELPSSPLIPATVVPWMKKFYPTHVDDTCGLHVHQSFRWLKHYHQLMIPEYQATMLKELGEFGHQEHLGHDHPLWARLAGNSEYCKNVFTPILQATQTKKDHSMSREGNRYTVMNFPFLIHGTIECRVLPMFEDVNQAIRAVRRVTDVTNAFLVATGKQNRREKRADIKIEYGDVYTEYSIEMIGRAR